LDKFYALQPGRAHGAKRLVVLGSHAQRSRIGEEQLECIGRFATIAWTGAGDADVEGFREYEEAAAS
jgi:hypothetical protein